MNSAGYVPNRINPTPEYLWPGHHAPKRASTAGIKNQDTRRLLPATDP